MESIQTNTEIQPTKIIDFIRPPQLMDMNQNQISSLILASIGIIISEYANELPKSYTSGKLFTKDGKIAAVMIYDDLRDLYVIRLNHKAFNSLANASNVLVVDAFNFQPLDQLFQEPAPDS